MQGSTRLATRRCWALAEMAEQERSWRRCCRCRGVIPEQNFVGCILQVSRASSGVQDRERGKCLSKCRGHES